MSPSKTFLLLLFVNEVMAYVVNFDTQKYNACAYMWFFFIHFAKMSPGLTKIFRNVFWTLSPPLPPHTQNIAT